MEHAIELTEVSRNQLISEILHIGHGDLSIYNNIGIKATKAEPELFAHLIAWNHVKGEVRDSKVALPILALRGEFHELYENAVAHLCLLDPRNFLRAIKYHKELNQLHPTMGGAKILKAGVILYLRLREQNRGWWNKTVIQHRKSLKALYALFHVKPASFAQHVLFDRGHPKGIFLAIKQLKDMSPEEAAGTILNYEIPFTVAIGALGGIKNKPDIVLALIERMSGNELITNTKMLQKCGVFENPALKAAYDKAIERTKKDSRVSTLKASRAAEVITDKKAIKKLKQIQEDRLEALGGIEGDWLILGDRSGSMDISVEVAKHIAALIAQQVKGKVHLVFFNTAPTYYEADGKSLEQIKKMTEMVRAGGGTSIGCGLDLIFSKNIVVNGIAICSDGGENTIPNFTDVYKHYTEKLGLEPTVYLLHVPGEKDVLSYRCLKAQISLEEIELGQNVDYYSLPNIIKTLKTRRYMLVEEIMEMPLKTFNDVFKQ